MSRLSSSFYTRSDVVQISQELLGKYIFSAQSDGLTAGMIVETEAYSGRNDKACHAYNNKRTKRTEIMYAEGGKAYVYICYGIHSLFNVVTNQEGQADAVLIRAVEPKLGIDLIQKRREIFKLNPRLTAGPGILTKALGINLKHNSINLVESNIIWIEDKEVKVSPSQIIASPRVGIDYAEEDALLPWRFRLRDSDWCSPAK